MMNYDELYRELERDAREAGLEKEHLEWQLGLEGWAKDPVAVAMRDWRLQHAPETLEGKSEEQVGREMAMVHLLAESRGEQPSDGRKLPAGHRQQEALPCAQAGF